MYIVAIAWLFVALMVAAAQPSILASLITLFFWGIFPLGLFLWIMGSGERRRRRALAEQAVHNPVGQDDGADARRDQ